jgi:hypothetical protein
MPFSRGGPSDNVDQSLATSEVDAEATLLNSRFIHGFDDTFENISLSPKTLNKVAGWKTENSFGLGGDPEYVLVVDAPRTISTRT